jgi:hypothetical protein
VFEGEGGGMCAARVALEVRSGGTWTSFWVAGYREVGVDGVVC